MEAIMTKTHKKLFRNVLAMSYSDARKFFLKGESYHNFNLPKYFKFDELLADISKSLEGKELVKFYIKKCNPSEYEDVNYKILHNKDGKYAWRPFKLINPVFYVAMVHKITEKKHWEKIISRFHEFSKNKKIKCMSLPLESYSDTSDKAKQINQWWREVEQKSIELSLEYQYIIKTDITDCYGAIYTHSIAWALHEKTEAKKNRKDNTIIGNIIDTFLRNMSHGQTNGIPQGSVLMDFVAEMVLGYADELLSEKIKEKGNLKKYKIIRFYDDYRIFINNPVDGDIIVKYLCEVLSSLGLKINPNKTIFSQNIIDHAVKKDKIFWINQVQSHENLQKHLLIIHGLANQYPNSGSLSSALCDYNKRISKKINSNDAILLISIIVDIAYNNPKVYPESAAILSKLISFIGQKNGNKKLTVINKIKLRFDNIPNTGYLQLWLQRITINIDKKYSYDENLCKLVSGEDVKIWNFDWLHKSFRKCIDVKKIIDHKLIKSLPDVIEKDEVELFKSSNNWY
jgi:RNA-directed DNA polymerase